MIKLIKLELQRMNLRPYLISSFIFGIILLSFTYFVAYVAQLEHEVQFQNYENIFRFTSAISIILFSTLSATMYSHLIIEEYSSKRLTLLFSYPISRKKIFIAKILIVFLFVFVSMLLCTITPITIFVMTESIVPIVSDTMNSSLLVTVFKTASVSLIAVDALSLLAMRIGFIKKSISVTLISAFVLSGFYSNIAISFTENNSIYLLIIVISILIILFVLATLSNKINHMEVE